MNMNVLLQAYQQGCQFSYVFFWGHTGKVISKNCLSQWYPIKFEEKGIQYSSAEQYMMAEKAALFKDEVIYQQILATSDVKEIKALGRRVREFQQDVWDEHCMAIVVAGNLAKFSQNQVLKDYLLSTKDSILVEASPYDNVWGIGLAETADDIENPLTWQGKNLLGFALMAVRDQLTIGNK